MRLTLREVKDLRNNGSGYLTHTVSYAEAKLLPFMREMEIPASVAYPIAKEVFDQSGLEPDERRLFCLVKTDESVLDLMHALLEAAYPDNICVVDNGGEYGSNINCYVYKLEYGKKFIRQVIDLIEKPEEAVFHLESQDELLRALAHRTLQGKEALT